MIIVDSQEPSEYKVFDGVERLPSADFKIGDDIGVERKQLSDLIASAHDNRLWNQAEELILNYKHPIILIHDMKNSLRWMTSRDISMVIGIVGRLVASYPQISIIMLPHWFSPRSFLKKVNEKLNDPKVHKRTYKRLKGDRKLAMLRQAPGISEKIAEKLLTYFNRDIKKILNGTYEEFRDAGLGKVRATTLEAFFNFEDGIIK